GGPQDLPRCRRRFGRLGAGTRGPVFAVRGDAVAGYPRVVGDGHLKLQLAQDGARLGAIGCRMAEWLKHVDVNRGPIDVAFQLHEDRWGDRVLLQARLVDLRPAAGPEGE